MDRHVEIEGCDGAGSGRYAADETADSECNDPDGLLEAEADETDAAKLVVVSSTPM
ncbi:MAG: hypothetical protein INR71_06165 [Terriglobus roseus]|nr:hypothetical protein [Terriglobus roseus]